MTQIRLASGILIDTTTGQAIAPEPDPETVEMRVPEASKRSVHEAGRDRINKAVRTNLADLPADTKSCTTVGLVYLYFMLGLNDMDIAHATGLRLNQVEMVKGMALFDKIDVSVRRNMKSLSDSGIRQKIQELSERGIEVLEDAINDTRLEMKERAKIANQMLDRAGFRAADVVEHRLSLEGGLTIKVVHDVTDEAIVPPVHVSKVIDHDAEL